MGDTRVLWGAAPLHGPCHAIVIKWFVSEHVLVAEVWSFEPPRPVHARSSRCKVQHISHYRTDTSTTPE